MAHPPCKNTSSISPNRLPIPWEEEGYFDEQKFLKELRRVFDICHTCRRCFNLCGLFPKLFNMIDRSETGELDSLSDEDLWSVLPQCTLCDLCFLSKCPYVPPHPWNVDLPHLVVQGRAILNKKGYVPKGEGKPPSVPDKLRKPIAKAVACVDAQGKVCTRCHSLVNPVLEGKVPGGRLALEKIGGFHAKAKLPLFNKAPYSSQSSVPNQNTQPKTQEKVVLFGGCFTQYQGKPLGDSLTSLFQAMGLPPLWVYPGCCAMPLLEQGDLEAVKKKALQAKKTLLPWVQEGYSILSVVPSCTLMIKSEWPLILSKDPDFQKIGDQTQDIGAYLLGFFKKFPEKKSIFQPDLNSRVAFHTACHARAQNQGEKMLDLLKLVFPKATISKVERCSGHGGIWGYEKDHFPEAMEFGKKTSKALIKDQPDYILSECPLAVSHLDQLVQEVQEATPCWHPLTLLGHGLKEEAPPLGGG